MGPAFSSNGTVESKFVTQSLSDESKFFASIFSLLSFFAISISQICLSVRDLKTFVEFFEKASKIINGTRIEFMNSVIYIIKYTEGKPEMLAITNKIVQIMKRHVDTRVDFPDKRKCMDTSYFSSIYFP